MHQTAMFAAKTASLAALKGAIRLLENLTDEEREQLRGQISEVASAIKATTVSMSAGSSVKELQRRRQEVMHPSTTAIIARTIVRALRDERGSVTAKTLAEHLGTTVDDDDFSEALNLALADGRITTPSPEEPGDRVVIYENDRLSARTAASILEAHPLVQSSGQAEDYMKRVAEAVNEVGAATINELRASIGVGDTATTDAVAAFEAGLAEALDRELIQWVGRSLQPSLYAVPEKELHHPWMQDQVPSLADATRRLRQAVAALVTDLATARRASATRRHVAAPRSVGTPSTPSSPSGKERPPKPPVPGGTLDASQGELLETS